MITTIICLVVTLAALGLMFNISRNADNQADRFATERESWKTERQLLLDRIQAGSFAEYKTQEVRVIKAQTVEKETPKLEQL